MFEEIQERAKKTQQSAEKNRLLEEPSLKKLISGFNKEGTQTSYHGNNSMIASDAAYPTNVHSAFSPTHSAFNKQQWNGSQTMEVYNPYSHQADLNTEPLHFTEMGAPASFRAPGQIMNPSYNEFIRTTSHNRLQSPQNIEFKERVRERIGQMREEIKQASDKKRAGPLEEYLENQMYGFGETGRPTSRFMNQSSDTIQLEQSSILRHSGQKSRNHSPFRGGTQSSRSLSKTNEDILPNSKRVQFNMSNDIREFEPYKNKTSRKKSVPCGFSKKSRQNMDIQSVHKSRPSDKPYFCKSVKSSASKKKQVKQAKTVQNENQVEMVDSLIVKEDDYRRMLTSMVHQVRKQKHDRSLFRDTSNYSLILKERFPQKENIISNKQVNTKERIRTIQEEAVHALFVAHDYQGGVTRLLTSEKLIKQAGEKDDVVLLRLYNSFLLMSAYFNQGDHQRIVRMGDSSAPGSLGVLLDSFTKKNKVRKEVGNYVLHLFFMQARSSSIRTNHTKAQTLFFLVMRLFDKWRNCSYVVTAPHHHNEFTEDDYIMAKASYAEQLMHASKLIEAIEKFEQVKHDIQKQVVFENHLLTVNVSNQVANCYLKVGQTQKALDNFENSLYVLKKYPEVEVGAEIVAKICSNISILYAEKGYLNDSVRMAEKCLDYKLQTYPQLHPEIMTTYLQIGTAYLRLADHSNAYSNFDASYQISKQVHGEFDQQTAYIVTQMATTKFKLSYFTDSIKLFEQAGVIYSRLEGQSGDRQEVTNNLDKIYLQLLNLYYLVGKDQEALAIYQVIEARSNDATNGYKLLNETANIMRKYNLLDNSIAVYKKALSTLKQVHKTNYLQQPETIMVLTNIATAEYLKGNHKESIRYYEHALSVAQRTSQLESAKVHLALGHVLKDYGSQRQAHSHYLAAVGTLDRADKDAEINKLLLEAVHAQKMVETNLY